MAVVCQIRETEALRIDGQLVDRTAGDSSGCGGDRASPVCSDQVEAFGFVLIATHPRNQSQHVVDALHEQRVVVAVGVGRCFSRVGNDLLLRERFSAAEELTLAIIKINPTRSLNVMPLGTSSDLMLGESVIAVGNAYGYENTMTTGIIGGVIAIL